MPQERMWHSPHRVKLLGVDLLKGKLLLHLLRFTALPRHTALPTCMASIRVPVRRTTDRHFREANLPTACTSKALRQVQATASHHQAMALLHPTHRDLLWVDMDKHHHHRAWNMRY